MQSQIYLTRCHPLIYTLFTDTRYSAYNICDKTTFVRTREVNLNLEKRQWQWCRNFLSSKTNLAFRFVFFDLLGLMRILQNVSVIENCPKNILGLILLYCKLIDASLLTTCRCNRCRFFWFFEKIRFDIEN